MKWMCSVVLLVSVLGVHAETVSSREIARLPGNDWTNDLKGLKGTELVDFLKSGQKGWAYEYEKTQVFRALQQMGTSAVVYLDEMLELARLDLPLTDMHIMNGLARETLVSIGSASAIPVARQMWKSEGFFWSGQEILLQLKQDAAPAIPVLERLRDEGRLPVGRTAQDINRLLIVLGTQ